MLGRNSKAWMQSYLKMNIEKAPRVKLQTTNNLFTSVFFERNSREVLFTHLLDLRFHNQYFIEMKLYRRNFSETFYFLLSLFLDETRNMLMKNNTIIIFERDEMIRNIRKKSSRKYF